MEIASALSAASGTASTADKSATGLADDFNNFLTLLTTQLKYQDPLEPMKSNEFIQQLVSFTEVEQSIGTNKNLEKLLSAQTANQTTGALGYIGKTVSAESKTLALSGGTAEVTYDLPATAANATIAVVDSTGKVVFSAPAETTVGKHGFTWDGKDLGGNQLPDGAYNFAIAATDSEKQIITATTSIVAKVTGVDSNKDGIMLSFGPTQVAIDKVTSVRETPAKSGI